MQKQSLINLKMNLLFHKGDIYELESQIDRHERKE
jgi:hypothetical protein